MTYIPSQMISGGVATKPRLPVTSSLPPGSRQPAWRRFLLFVASGNILGRTEMREVVRVVPMTILIMNSVDNVEGSVEMVWNLENPVAVELNFSDPNGPVPWIVSRDLIARGMCTAIPYGEGDMTAWSTRDNFLRLHVTSPEGQADVAIAFPAVAEFLDATYTICMPDSELENERLGLLLDDELRKFGV